MNSSERIIKFVQRIPLVCDSIIITRSMCYTYTFGSCFDYKRWVRVSIKNLNFSFFGQVKRVD